MTDHDTLIEIEPLLRKLGWWPDDIKCDFVGRWWLFVPREPDDEWAYLGDSYALAIVTHLAEKELCERGWLRGPYPLTMYSEEKNDQCTSLADALRVEIERENNKEAQSHEAPYK